MAPCASTSTPTRPALKARWMLLRNTLERHGPLEPLQPLPPDSRSRLFMRDNGEEHRGFFGFEWQPGSKGLRVRARSRQPVRGVAPPRRPREVGARAAPTPRAPSALGHRHQVEVRDAARACTRASG